MQIFSFRISTTPFYINVQALKEHHRGIWGMVTGQCLNDFYIKLMIGLKEEYSQGRMWEIELFEHILSFLSWTEMIIV